MPVIRESPNLGDLLKYEAPNLYSRDVATVASGRKLALGTVVGRETATGKLKGLALAATDGTQVAAGVLAFDVDATQADRFDAILIARHATVASQALVWPAGITPVQQSAAVEQLETLGIVVRASA
ncbi:head decoration protein [Aquabacterium sp. A7-Y]|uniref:head decoration protein n=1 Tax=Aquabacterium sp. A7-Y TaxID=1349605 RepID=UPI00223CF564|nr:head decoration protein [Aquabacterium sp. A7-Y]MCW7542100.1 head decoration protein [Aquabacterium sp. A7-Y]